MERAKLCRLHVSLVSRADSTAIVGYHLGQLLPINTYTYVSLLCTFSKLGLCDRFCAKHGRSVPREKTLQRMPAS